MLDASEFPNVAGVECSVPSGEEEVFNGTNQYLCLLEDDRFEGDWRLKVLTPYKAKMFEADPYKWGFGWSQYGGYNIYQNAFCPVFEAHEMVVAFKKL